MSYKAIESDANPTYKELKKIQKGIPEKGLFLVEGEDLVEEARKNGAIRAYLFPLDTPAPWRKEPIYGLKEGLYRSLASYQSLPKVMAVCEKKLSEDLGPRLVVLDRIQDPGNAGTIVRTALSFGYTGVLFSPDSVSVYNAKCVQATKGALFSLPVGRYPLEKLAAKGYHIFSTALDGKDEKDVSSLPEPFALVFGNEGQGVRKEIAALGEKLRIEMSGIDSLNVAVAAGIFLYRFQKRK